MANEIISSPTKRNNGLKLSIGPEKFRLPLQPSAQLSMILVNKNNCPICFTVDTNSPETLKIEPRKGCLTSGSEVRILIKRPDHIPIIFKEEYLIFKVKQCHTCNTQRTREFVANLCHHNKNLPVDAEVIIPRMNSFNLDSENSILPHTNTLIHDVSSNISQRTKPTGRNVRDANDHQDGNNRANPTPPVEFSATKQAVSSTNYSDKTNKHRFKIYEPFQLETYDSLLPQSAQQIRKISPINPKTQCAQPVKIINSYIKRLKSRQNSQIEDAHKFGKKKRNTYIDLTDQLQKSHSGKSSNYSRHLNSCYDTSGRVDDVNHTRKLFHRKSHGLPMTSKRSSSLEHVQEKLKKGIIHPSEDNLGNDVRQDVHFPDIVEPKKNTSVTSILLAGSIMVFAIAVSGFLTYLLFRK